MAMIGNYQLRGFAAQKRETEQHPSFIINLKKTLAAVMLLVVAFTSYAQTDGDYQSKSTPVNWGVATSWQVYSGGAWIDAVNYPGQVAGAGLVTIQNGHTITLNVSPAFAIGALTVGQGTSGTLTGDAVTTRTITTGALTVMAGGTFTLNRTTLTVNGATSISGSMVDGNGNGTMTYVGSFTVNTGGTFTNTSTSASTFRGGFENNGTYTSSGTATHLFNTNPQTIKGTGATAISGAVTVTGIAVTNEATNFRINSTLAGTGSWTQAVNSILLVGGTGTSLTITTVDFTATGNKVNYCRNGTQNVRATTYYHLTDSVANVKTLLGNITVNGNLEIEGTCTMACAQYQITGNASGTFTMATATALTLGNTLDGTDVLFPTNFIAANITLSGTATVTYQNLTTQTVSHVPSYRNLTISTTGSTKTVTGNLTVGGNLVVNTGATLVLGTSTTLAAITGNGTLTGTFDLGTAATTLTIGGNCAIAGSLIYNGTSTKSVTINGNLSGAGTLNMSGGTLPHNLTLNGTTNTITTFTTAASSTVTYSRANTQTIITSVNYRNLRIENAGTKSSAGIIAVAEDFYIDSLATFNPAGFDFTVSGNSTIYYGTFGDALIGGTTSLQDLELISGTMNGAANGVVNVGGQLSVLSGNGTLGRVQLTVTDTTKIGTGRTLLMNNNNGIKRFNSLIQVQGTGVVTATGITTATNLDLRAGITVEAAGGSFAGGGAIFNANQNLAGLGPISFANATTIAAGIVVTNTNTQGITLTGTITGANATSQWTQAANSVCYYRSATQPMATGILDASANNNFFHYSLGGAQTIETATYYNLTLSGAGSFTKTLSGNPTVNGAFQLDALTLFNPSTFNMTVAGVSTIAGTISDASATGVVDFTDVDLSGGTINNATFIGVFDINGNLSIPSSNGTIGRGAVTVYGTTTIATGRTLNLNVNSGVKRFDGQIIVQGTGVFSSTTITTAANLDIRGGINVLLATGAFNAGAAIFNATQDIEGAGPISFTSAVTVASNMTVTNLNTYGVTFGAAITGGNASSVYEQGVNSVTYYQPAANTAPMLVGVLDASGTNNTFYYSTAGAQNVRVPLTNYYHLRLSGGSSGIKTLLGNTTANGKLSIAASTSLQVAGFSISVGDSAIVNGTFNDNNDAGTNTFTGHLNVTASGTLSTANASPFVFEGGITNDGTFNKTGTGAVSFNSNNQDINGSASITMAGNVTIATNRIVTNKNTGTINLSGILNGANAASTWVNDVNSTVNYSCTASANRPMATGVLDASATGNNFYYSRANAQTIKAPVDGYYNLFISGGAFTKTLGGITLVINDLNIAATCTLSVDNTQNYALTVNGDFLNSGVFQPHLGTMTFNGTADQVFMPSNTTYYNVVVDNSGTEITLSGSDLTITGTLTLTNGVITTGANMVVLTSTNANSLSGFSSSSFINGTLRRSITTNTSTYSFPVGNGTGAANYYRADIINDGLQGVSYLTASFNPLSNHDDNDLTAEDIWETGSLIYNSINTAGMWVIETNGNVTPSAGEYAIALYTGNMSGLTDNNFGPLKRPVGTDGSAWTPGSGRLSNNNGDGRMVADGYALRTGLGSFSEFGVGSGSSSGHGLPIELVAFDAALIGQAVQLTWETATETDNDYFTVERSADGEIFTELTVVEGAGNSSQPLSYESLDMNPLAGTSYYRLKQTDYNGNYAYSNVVSVTVNKSDLFTISPNPVVGGSRIVVSMNKEEITGGAQAVTISDMTGKAIFTQALGLWENPTLHLELPADLATGIYMLSVKCLNNTLQKKILVQ